MPTPEETRKAMADQMNREMRAAIGDGRVRGVDPATIPNPDAAAAPPAATPAAAAPAAVAPTPAPTPAPVATPAPAPTPTPQGKVFNKYENLEQAEKGYWNATNALSKATDRISELEARLAESTSRVGSGSTLPDGASGERPRVNPVAPRTSLDWTKDEAVVKASEVSGIDVSVLAQLAQSIHSRAGAEAEAVVDNRLTPLTAAASAQAYMAEKYPAALQHQVEIKNFVATTPEVKEVVATLLNAGNPTRAMEYAWQMYAVATGLRIENTMAENAQIAESERVAARAASGLPASPANPPTNAGPVGPTPEEIAFLKQKAQEGDEKAKVLLRRIYLGPMIPAAARTWERQ